MSTLAYSRHTYVPTEAKVDQPKRASFWRRLFDSMVASQQRRAEREIAAYISRRGGLFTDEVERDIMRNLAGNGRGFKAD
jgi:hypothetical protein